MTTLHRQKTSAYHATLLADDDGVVLVTQTGFISMVAGRPAQEHAIALGPVTTRRRDALVFWRAGSLREISLLGGSERELAPMPRAPRYLLASEDRIAWIHAGGQTETSLHTLAGVDVRVVHESAKSVSAPVLHAADVYWVEQERDGTWRIARIGLDGRHPMSSAPHRGRPPAMLGAGHDGVYFYEGLQRGVRKLSFDLQREDPVFTGAVCSPLAVFDRDDRVLCAQVGGIFDIPRSGTAPRFLAAEHAGPIAALAMTSSRAYWVTDDGAEQLTVRSITLPEP